VQSPKATSLVGSILDQRYQLQEIIGSGANATIYRAEDLSRKYAVAVKVLTGAAADSKSKERFRHGAEVASALAHPNIVRLYSFNVTAEGARYCVMDCVKGKNLADILKENGRLSEAACISIFGQVCDALEHAHAKGVVHRNLKPSNIMLIDGPGDSYIVKIADFGLAKARGEKETRQSLAKKGEFVGNALYMSPEQCSGGKIDGRSDIYAVACLLYQCLVGQPPYGGANPFEVMNKHLNDPPVQLPADLDAVEHVSFFNAILARGLTKRVDGRYQSAGEMSHDLNLILEVPESEWEARAVAMRPVSASAIQAAVPESTSATSSVFRATFFVCFGLLALLLVAGGCLVAVALTDADIKPLLRYKIAVQEIILPANDPRLIRNLTDMTEYLKSQGRYADAYQYNAKLPKAVQSVDDQTH
jgi:serine/threonine-protein kinase